MAKPELGTKRQCRSCDNRFYDLNRDPILCPKCGAVFQLHEGKPTSPEGGEVGSEEEAKVEPAEIVSLEEAEGATADKVTEADDEVEAAEGSGAEETFLEEEEEGEDDVSTLIDGDIEDDEEA